MPIRRPRGPKPALRHVDFLESVASAGIDTPAGATAQAAFLTLRLVDEWVTSGVLIADANIAVHTATVAAIDAAGHDTEVQSALRRIVEGIVLLGEPDAQPMLPRVYAFGSLLELRGEFVLAADVYGTVSRYVDSRAHLDLAFDALMRRGFCLRTAGQLEDAERCYQNASTLAGRVRDRARVLYARIGLAKVTWSRGDLPGADAELAEIVAEAESLGDRRLHALALHDVSSLARLRGDNERAVRFAFESLKRSDGERDRERLLSDLGNLLGVCGAWDAARAALRLLESGAHEQEVRWKAQLNLMDLAAREGSEPSFEQYRRALSSVNLPARLGAEYLRDAGSGLLGFGRTDEARTSLERGLLLARSSGAHQVEFQIQELLDNLSAVETAAARRRPSVTPLPAALMSQIEDELRSAAGVS